MKLGKIKIELIKILINPLKTAINQVIKDLDNGKSRVAEKINGEWVTHQHLKKSNHVKF